MPALFYHLTHKGQTETVLALLGRARQAGWRVGLRAPRPALESLDHDLWLAPGDDSFLAHGLADGSAQDADQPVLLAESGLAPGLQALMCLDGAPVSAEEVAALERVWILFSAEDPQRLATARAQWRALVAAGAAAEYWSDESGRWEKKAAS